MVGDGTVNLKLARVPALGLLTRNLPETELEFYRIDLDMNLELDNHP